MENTGALVAGSKLQTAVDRALDEPPRLLPPSSIHPCLSARRTELGKWIYQSIAGEWLPARESVVPVSKGRHGIRPVSVWDWTSTATYSALVDGLTEFVATPVRNGAAWQGFQTAPLALPGEYVVSADITACYLYIDHAILSQELLIQSGLARDVGEICSLLREVSGRSYGIPQQSKASDVLAEAYLDRLERAVVRRGVEVSRYNDDFRFNCQKWSEVVRGLEILSEEARNIGLALNDSKVFTWRKSRYESRLAESKTLRDMVASEAELDLTMLFLDYDGDVLEIEPEPKAVELAAAVRILERWKSVAGRGNVAERRRAEHRALVELLPFALRVLSADVHTAPDTLLIVMLILRFEQSLTPHVASFLATRNDEGAVLGAFDSALRKDAYLTGWQVWWLQQPLARLPGFASGPSSKARVSWLLSIFGSADRNPILKAEAALTLAQHRLISVDDLLSIYDRSTAVERPTVVAALGYLKPGSSVRRSVSDDMRVHGWIFDWAAALV